MFFGSNQPMANRCGSCQSAFRFRIHGQFGALNRRNKQHCWQAKTDLLPNRKARIIHLLRLPKLSQVGVILPSKIILKSGPKTGCHRCEIRAILVECRGRKRTEMRRIFWWVLPLFLWGYLTFLTVSQAWIFSW